MKTILFTPFTANLAETTRALLIAQAIADKFDCRFTSYGGQFEELVEKAGFPLTRLEPRVTPELMEHAYAVERGKKLDAFMPLNRVRQMVAGEIEFLRELRPAAVVTGMTISYSISCPATNTPLVWVIQPGMRVLAAARSGAFQDLDMLAPLRWLPKQARVALSAFLLTQVMKVGMSSFDRVAREHNMTPFASFDGLFQRSDHLLVAEPPDFSDLPAMPSYHYVGPLVARLDVPIPDEIQNLPKDRPIIYFAMGSSGDADVVSRILTGFAGKPYRVIAPVRRLLEKQPSELPDNVLLTDWLPAHKVNPLADISVIHGGIGTVMTACLAGKPVVGVAMQPEQQANLDNLAKKGFAVRIPKGELNPQRLCAEIDHLLADPVAKQKAREYQQVVQQWDDPQYLRKFFQETFASQSMA